MRLKKPRSTERGLAEYKRLFCAEEAVARISESGKDISVFVQASIQGGNVDFNVGMSLCNAGNTLGCTDDCHKLNILAAAFFEHIYGIAGAATGGKHWVDDQNEFIFNAFGKFAIIFLGLQGLLVSVKTDMANFSRREENVNSVYHTEACSKDRNNDYCVILNHILSTGFKGSLDLTFNGRNTFS